MLRRNQKDIWWHLKINCRLVAVTKALLEHSHSHTLYCVLHLFCCTWAAKTETMRPVKQKIHLFGPGKKHWLALLVSKVLFLCWEQSFLCGCLFFITSSPLSVCFLGTKAFPSNQKAFTIYSIAVVVHMLLRHFSWWFLLCLLPLTIVIYRWVETISNPLFTALPLTLS